MSDEIEVVSDFVSLKMNVILVDDDMQRIFDRVMEIGTLDYEEEIDTKDSKEPYRFMQSYMLKENGDAEILWLDTDKEELGAIRVSVVVDDKEEEAYNSGLGLTKDNSIDGVRNDSRSSTMSRYMRMCFERTLGLR